MHVVGRKVYDGFADGLCGCIVWFKPQTYKASARILAGPIPKCGHCERILAGKKGGK
jgi:hypothetical protein